MSGSDSRLSLSRRHFLAVGAVATGTAATAAATRTLSPSPAFAGSASGTDAYSAEVTLMTSYGWYAAPIHSILMPNGQLFCLGLARPTLTPTAATPARRVAWTMPAPLANPLPSQLVVSSINEPVDYSTTGAGLLEGDDAECGRPQPIRRDGAAVSTLLNDDLFCTGQTLTADGRFFSAGGTRQTFNASSGALISVTGLPYSTVFDGQNWTRVVADMIGVGQQGEPYRWYPAVTSLPDGRLLVTSGFVDVIPNATVNLSVEVYDLTSQSWTVLSPFGQVPNEIIMSDYTAAFVLPSAGSGFDLVMVGEPGVPVLFSLAGKWSVLNNLPRPGTQAWQAARVAAGGSWNSHTAPDQGASASMLPIRLKNGDWGYNNGAIMINGSYVNSAWSSQIDVYDVFASSWHPTITAPVARANPATVFLPDGHVLVINGHGSDPNIGKATLIDLASGSRAVMGTADMGLMRGYHNVATLLPDGSVMVGGGRDLVTDSSHEKPTLQYYYPPYMYANRPQLLSPPSALHYGQTFALGYSGQAPPSDMVLIALGAMTHAFDMHQRFIQLDIAGTVAKGSNAYTVVGVAPPSTVAAPPGHYMIFVLDSNRLPTHGAIVSLS